jgi:hypothetical protein
MAAKPKPVKNHIFISQIYLNHIRVHSGPLGETEFWELMIQDRAGKWHHPEVLVHSANEKHLRLYEQWDKMVSTFTAQITGIKFVDRCCAHVYVAGFGPMSY